MRKLAFIFIGLVSAFTQKAQDLTAHFRLLNSSNGLTSNNVQCVYRDHRGFLWIGTNSGLNRFDGKNIVHYTHQPRDTASLGNNGINAICEDDKGRIWLATEGGVSVLNVQTGRFMNIISVASGDTVIDLNGFIPSVAYYRQRVYIGLRAGILSTTTDSISITAVSKENLHYSKTLRCLPNRAFSTGKGLWFATFAGLFCTEDGLSFQNKDFNPKAWRIFDQGTVFSFANEGDSVAYFGTWGYEGMYRFRYASNQLDSFAFKGLPNILVIGKVRGREEIWAGTFTRGILVLDLKTGERHYQQREHSDTKAVSDILVNQVLVDEDGTAFCATGLGLYYVNPFHAQFETIVTAADKGHDFPPSMPFALEADNYGKIWCGSFVDGLFSFDPATKAVRYHRFAGNYNRIWSIFNADTALVLGSYSGLARFDLRTNELLPIRLPPSLSDNTQNGIVFLQKITDDEFWVGLWQHGLLRFNLHTGKFRYFSGNDSVNKIAGNSPYCALTLSGKIYIGFVDLGIISVIDNQTNRVTNLKIGSDGRSYGGIGALAGDKKGRIWVGTMGGGVFCLDTAGSILAEYTTAEGLTNNGIAFLQFDDHDDLWIGTSNGLNKLEPDRRKISTYTTSDGLPSNQFNHKVVAKQDEGTLYMICDTNLVKFHPAKLKANHILPKLQMLSIQKSGVPDAGDELSLTHHDKVVVFEFTAVNFIDPDKTQFAYKLEGFDHDWTYSGKRNYVNYTSLPPGDYTLQIKATNQHDNWLVPEHRILLHVAAPFWKTWWFFALCLLATFLMAYAIYYLRLQQVLRIQAIRDKISKDLHDDIGSALSSIAIYSEVAKKYSEGKVPEIVTILTSLQDTAKGAMENMSDIVWSINPKNDLLSDTLTRLEIFANGLLNAKGIQLRFAADRSVNEHKTSMQQRKNIYLICKEAISNVARYSEARNCTVEISDDNKKITISIRDDGVGMADEKKTLGGNGILNMKKRAEELKGMLEIMSEKNRGTVLSLRFML